MAFSKLLTAIVFVSLFFSCAARPAPSSRLGGQSYEAIYSFGDSLTDTGNLIRQGLSGGFGTIGNSPYGESMGGATGRCSDGRLMIDFISDYLHLPSPPPYLDTSNSRSSTTGVNFAVAGATALDVGELSDKGIGNTFTSSSLGVQLGWFKDHLKSAGSTDLGKALFLLGEVGGNDYNYALAGGKQMDEVTALIPDVVNKITDTAEELINMGARHFVVPGNFPIGCMPIYLTMFQGSDASVYDGNKCVKSLNEFAQSHNSHLEKALEGLRSKYSDVAIKYADLYNSLQDLVGIKVNEGLDERAHSACCGGGGGGGVDQ